MKRIATVLMLLLVCIVTITGCTDNKKNEPAPKPPEEQKVDSEHLTAEQQGITLSISRQLRSMSGMITSTKENHEVKGLLVKLENASQNNIAISPDFVTLKTTDGTEYKYSPQLSEILGKSSFIKRQVPPDYEGGGIILFEIKKGAVPQEVTYKDDSGHNMVVKFATDTGTNTNV